MTIVIQVNRSILSLNINEQLMVIVMKTHNVKTHSKMHNVFSLSISMNNYGNGTENTQRKIEFPTLYSHVR